MPSPTFSVRAKAKKDRNKDGVPRSRSNLLDLPTEVLESILSHLSPCTYFICLLICKSIFNIATTSTRLIRRQTNGLAGFRYGHIALNHLNADLVFRRGASRSLCGAHVLADSSTYQPPPGIKPSRSALSDLYTLIGNNGVEVSFRMLGMADDNGRICVYYLYSTRPARRDPRPDHHIILLKRNLEFPTSDMVSLQRICQIQPPYGHEGPITTHRMAFGPKGDLIAIYEHKAARDLDQYRGPLTPVSPPPEPSEMKLAIFDADILITDKLDFESLQHRTCEVPFDHDSVVQGLQMASNGNIAMAWRRPEYAEEEGAMDWNCLSIAIVTPCLAIEVTSLLLSSARDVLYTRMRFVGEGNELLLHGESGPVYSHSASIRIIDGKRKWKATRNESLLNNHPYVHEKMFEVGLPFFGRHRTHQHADREECIVDVFALAVSRLSDESPVTQLFIVYCAHPVTADSCDHQFDLETIRPDREWRPCVLLHGWQPSTSNLGTIIAISPCDHRIAAAMWDRILIWTFFASALDAPLSRYFPPGEFSWDHRLGRLYPVELPTRGAIVHHMEWLSDTELVTLTDRGLVRWDVGCMAKGLKKYDYLPTDLPQELQPMVQNAASSDLQYTTCCCSSCGAGSST